MNLLNLLIYLGSECISGAFKRLRGSKHFTACLGRRHTHNIHTDIIIIELIIDKNAHTHTHTHTHTHINTHTHTHVHTHTHIQVQKILFS